MAYIEKKMAGSIKKAGIGYTATATNRSTGKKTTKSGTLTPTTKSSFASDSGKMLKTSTARKASTKKTTHNRAKVNERKYTY